MNHDGEGDSASPQISKRRAYFEALDLWIHQAKFHQNLSTCFPYYMMSIQGLQNLPPNVNLVNNNYQQQGQPWGYVNYPANAPHLEATDAGLLPAEIISRHGGFEYVIPPLYKRLFAEFIDFLLLFVLKIVVTFTVADMFDIIDMDKFDFAKLGENLEDYKLAMEFTSDLVVLEIIYKILVSVFEASCVCGGPNRIGGATPGKALLGLRVVTATAILPVEGRPKETVLLYPGKACSFPVALVRSICKNMLISLLFPLCFVMFLFKHNRTGYDLICNTIVVEENMFPPRRNVP